MIMLASANSASWLQIDLPEAPESSCDQRLSTSYIKASSRMTHIVLQASSNFLHHRVRTGNDNDTCLWVLQGVLAIPKPCRTGSEWNRSCKSCCVWGLQDSVPGYLHGKQMSLWTSLSKDENQFEAYSIDRSDFTIQSQDYVLSISLG